MQLNFYFVCSWFSPWQKSCLIPPSWWNVAPTGFAEAAQAPWKTEGWPVLEEPFREKIHTRFNTVTVPKIIPYIPSHTKNLVSHVSREQVKSSSAFFQSFPTVFVSWLSLGGTSSYHVLWFAYMYSPKTVNEAVHVCTTCTCTCNWI